MRGCYHHEEFTRLKASTSMTLLIFEMMNFRFLYVGSENIQEAAMMNRIVKSNG